MSEVQLELTCVYDNEKLHLGGDQHWYKAKFHSLSGCGPTTAATILVYLAENFECCRNLYAYKFSAKKEDFIRHMDEVRDYVKPGINGLTSKTYFACELRRFAQTRDIQIKTKLINKNFNVDEAYEKIKVSIDKGFPLALLILRNPEPSLEELTWHWMVVIGYKDENKILVSTWGKIYELSFKKVWNHTGKNSSGIVEIYL